MFSLSPDLITNGVWQEAIRLTSAGISIIPIAADGTKDPAYSVLPTKWNEITKRRAPTWKVFQERIATSAEIESFYKYSVPGMVPGIGVICGKVSGGLEVIDVDDWHTAEAVISKLRSANPELFSRLVLTQSPRPGLHMYFRSSHCGKSCKLAHVPDPSKNNTEPKCIIEVKGEGGVCVAPGSPAKCHRTGVAYQYLQHHLSQVPTITPAERNFLLETCRSLSTWKVPASTRGSLPPSAKRQSYANDTPGNWFNIHGRWEDILIPHGWTLVRTEDDVSYWRRPGKSDGNSATTNYEHRDLLHVFSSNADPFEPDMTYTKFTAYTLLNHDGDFSAAAQAIMKIKQGKALRLLLNDNKSFREQWERASNQYKHHH